VTVADLLFYGAYGVACCLLITIVAGVLWVALRGDGS
jgi:hypothetical protein